MNEEYKSINLGDYQQKNSKIIDLSKLYKKDIKRTYDETAQFSIADFLAMIDLKNESEDNAQMIQEENLAYNTFKLKIPILEPLKLSVFQEMLATVNAQYEDQKFSIENMNEQLMEKQQDFNIQSNTAQQRILSKKFENYKNLQREKFLKYSQEELKSELLALDSQIDETFSYSFLYQQQGKQKEVQIKYCDLIKLNLPNYLNDALINFFIKILENLLIPVEIRESVYTFNTYFMEKLCPNDKIIQILQSDTQRLTDLFNRNYESIKRWVKEDLFQKKYLLFPLNLPEHWSLIVIRLQIIIILKQIVCNPMQIFDEERKHETCIIYLDSFGIIDSKIISIIKMYLHKNYLQHCPTHPSYNDSPISKIRSYQPLVPRQINYIDCGVFLLQYAESFLMDPTFLNQALDDQNAPVKLNWFPRALINRKRYQIKKIILDLALKSQAEAVQNYEAERLKIIEENCNIWGRVFINGNIEGPDQFDEIDHSIFEEFLRFKGVSNMSKEIRHQQLLDFYMNPNYNYYHNDESPLK